ncbi:hypothetical protein BDF20DRAFT_860774 [Mycotypha africana]|uniref:uncharacterized protein n=1 Tax=Mycotypha africana TaxID=64632 RepID=UPI002301A18C|nr:uncharacterized protein BDF20DRAFT_860774 [Mycotypha africana]KAI8984592.1 hypothetical protein BDF20DRAFT_860774 [Mycotypha africana]
MHSPNIRSGPISLEIRDKDYLLNHVDSVLNTKVFIRNTHALSSNNSVPTNTKKPITTATTVNVICAKVNSNPSSPTISTANTTTSTTAIAKTEPTEISTFIRKDNDTHYTSENKCRMSNVDLAYNRTFSENTTAYRRSNNRDHHQERRSDPFTYPQNGNRSLSSSDDDDDDEEEGNDDITTRLPSNLMQFHFEFGSKRPPRTTVFEEEDNTVCFSEHEDEEEEQNRMIIDKELLIGQEKEQAVKDREEEVDIYDLSTDDEDAEEQKRLGDTKYFPSATVEAIQTYETITENIYIGSATGRSMAEESMPCQCKYKENPCDDDNKCINRMMFMECMVQDCPCGRFCKNRRFQLGQYAPVDVIRTEKKGYGLRALTNLPPNSFVLEYIGEVIPQKEFLRRTREYDTEGYKHYYFMTLKNDEIIDATKKGCLARFINHSCNPNCVTQKWVIGKKMRIGIFTGREITAGEELTFDYKFERYGATAQICYCGEPNCKGYIGASAAEVSIMDNGESKTTALRMKRNRDLKRRQQLLQRQQQRQQDYNQQHLNIFSSSSEDEDAEELREKDQDDDGDNDNVDSDEEEEDLDSQPLQDVDKVHIFVKRMLNSVGNARLVNKLLNRLQITNVKNTLGREIFKSIIRLHGLKMFKFWLGEWKNDKEIVLKILHVLDKLPLSNRNGLDDCKLLDVLQKFVYYNSSDVSVLAQLLLDKWNKLKVVYRIPKRSQHASTNHNNSATATPSSEITQRTEDVERKSDDFDFVALKEEEHSITKKFSETGAVQTAVDCIEIKDEEEKKEKEKLDITNDLVEDSDDQSEPMDIDISDSESGFLESDRPNTFIIVKNESITSLSKGAISSTSQCETPLSEAQLPPATTDLNKLLADQQQTGNCNSSFETIVKSDDNPHGSKKRKNIKYESTREFFDPDNDYFEYFPINSALDDLPNTPNIAIRNRSHRHALHLRSAKYTTALTTTITNASTNESSSAISTSVMPTSSVPNNTTDGSTTTGNYTLLRQQQAAEQEQQFSALYNSTNYSYCNNMYYLGTTDSSNNPEVYSYYFYHPNYEAHPQQTTTSIQGTFATPTVPLSSWQTALTENGLPYYYNLLTHQTQWSMPEELQKLQNLIPPPPPPPLPLTTDTSCSLINSTKVEKLEPSAIKQAPPVSSQSPPSLSSTPAKSSELFPNTHDISSIASMTFDSITSANVDNSTSSHNGHNDHQLLTLDSGTVEEGSNTTTYPDQPTITSNNDDTHKPSGNGFLNDIDLKMEIGKVVTKYLSSRQQVLWNGDKLLFKDLARTITHFLVDREIQLDKKIKFLDAQYRSKIERFIDVYGSEYVAKLKQSSNIA